MRKTNQEGGVDTFRSCGTNQHLPLNGVVEIGNMFSTAKFMLLCNLSSLYVNLLNVSEFW